MIPKLLHQIWVGSRAVPSRYRDLTKTWQYRNRSWQYQLWDDASIHALIALQYPSLLATYQEIALPVMKADLARYLILKAKGGLYVDLDYECFKPVGNLLNKECVIGLEPHLNARFHGYDYLLGNAFIASREEHPFISFLIEYSLQKIALTDARTVSRFEYAMGTTGPFMVNAAYRDYSQPGSIKLLEPELISPLSYEEIVSHASGNEDFSDRLYKSYALHYFAGSWLSPN
jgi:mannosyltransferase OCH1-like enzyme